MFSNQRTAAVSAADVHASRVHLEFGHFAVPQESSQRDIRG